MPGIFISRLIPGGLAESTGLLAVNDEVLEVNGIEVNGKSLDQVTDMMVANSSNLIITIRPANQRGHSTLSGSFSSNTISSRDFGPGHHHGYNSAAQTNSLERGAQRAKKMQAPGPPLADFHNVHHPLHYGTGHSAPFSGMQGTPSNHHHHHQHMQPQQLQQHQQYHNNHFESLQRTAAHRHSASIIPAGQHHSHQIDHHGHQGHHLNFHHEPLGYHQFSSNRHSVIGGPGMGEGSHLMTGGSLSGALQGPSVLHHDDSSDDEDEDEVRDHFTTSLVINSGGPSEHSSSHAAGTSSSKPTNGNMHHNTTVIINNTTPNHQPLTISSVSLPVNRTTSSGSTTGGVAGSSKAAAASAANFIRNSLRKNGPTNAQQQHGLSKSFSANLDGSGLGNDARSLYAHVHHHSEAPTHQSRSPSSSPTTVVKAKPDTSTDDIVTL